MISSGRPPRRTRFCTVRSATPNRAVICSVVAPSRASLLNATTWSAGCMAMRTAFSASEDSAAASLSTTRHGTGWSFASVAAHLDVHLVVDNYATHKHAKVKDSLARRERCHMHHTPTYTSWINQVERWFGLITQQAIRHGSFSNVKHLVHKINDFVEHYNAQTRPFVWVATAESILAKIERLCSVISGTQHQRAMALTRSATT